MSTLRFTRRTKRRREATSPGAPRVWLLTGVTGCIGREMLARALARPEDRVIVMVRSRGAESARDRVDDLLDSLYSYRSDRCRERVEICPGDLTRPWLGLDNAGWNRLKRATHIVHMAARTRFDGTLDIARSYNVEGVRRMLEVARAAKENGSLRSFVHVSTAYVAGARTDTVSCHDLDPRGAFRNVYERSKAEAESLVREAFNELPCTVFRPSIVIGDSCTGEVVNFNTIYWAMRTYLKGQRYLFAKANAPLDLVPVDYVCDAMMHLIDRPESIGRTYLLAGGAKTTVSLGEFADAITSCFRSPSVVLLSPKLFFLVRHAARAGLLPRHLQRLVANAESYLPYFTSNPIFDTAETEAALAGSGIEVPHINEYVGRITGFCLSKGFGKNSPMLGRGGRTRPVILDQRPSGVGH